MHIQDQFDQSVREHLQSIPTGVAEALAQTFRDQDVVVLEQLLPEDLRRRMEDEALTILERWGRRRETVIPQTGNTPRCFSSAGRMVIKENGVYIPAFFSSAPIRDFLKKVNGHQDVLPVPYEPEEYLINRQEASGDTHGWHWDDYAFALIWMVESPSPDDGAWIEYVPHTEWNREDKEHCVQRVLDAHPVRRLHVPQGQCYFMKANTTMHRVSPLFGSSRRTVIVFTYASKEDMHKDISHETMEQIWADDIQGSGQTASKQKVFI
ncbi:hypothetical protein DUZ99_03410 [Xylanibacillus composti]|uniref:Fe2OG dioxygenase domain-containing protein n=1 Tax=Xylanibacillus composti TaxID=1572762 RepID=A0A8J4M3E1_9BACL|nr:hypothetical protein [Xylanibacillus composti]MDT9724048.1 hypothetical protein [Xylanibacillus composti]GIQ69441.1 hypothetical protein XYCOK13_22650 [Xylanibacillus composti]